MHNSRAIFVPLVAIIIGTFMVILDSTVVNVALPTLGRVFGVDLHLLQWVVSAYLLAQAAVIPLSGWLSDRFGAKRVYLVSLVLFTAGSALCGLVLSAEMLIGARVLQGLGGGMLMPIGMAVLYRLTPPERLGTIFGLFGLPLMVAPALGPVLSGYLLEYADWRLIFLINVPIGILGFWYGHKVLPKLEAGRPAGRLDIPGMVLGPVAFVALSFGISASISAGWTAPATVGGITIGLITLALFVWRELSTFEPVLELRVFARREFTLAIVTQWAAICVLFGTFFMVPLFLQGILGYGSLETGLITLPMAVASAIAMQIAGRAFDRIGARPPVLVGVSLLAVAMWQFTRLTSTTTGIDLFVPLALAGAGMGSMMPPLSSYMLNSAPRELVGRVTSLQAALQNVVGSLAIASFATLLQVWSFADVFRVSLVLALVAFGLAWTLRRSKPVVTDEGAEPHARPVVHEALA